jgi:hypothetical protein
MEGLTRRVWGSRRFWYFRQSLENGPSMPLPTCAPMLLLLALALPTANAADPVAAAAGQTAASGSARLYTVAADTELVFEMGATMTSKDNQRGDRFPLRLAEPLRIDGQLVIPAGTPAMGEVVHADRARAGGQAGELVLAARYLEWDGRQLALKSFRAGVGKDRSKSAMGVAIVASVAGFLVRGGQMEMPAGSLITAKLREAAALPAVPEPEATATPEAPAAPETPALIESTQGEIQP